MSRFFALVFLLSQLAFAVESIPLSKLEDMWRAGQYREVEVYARARLAGDPDDLFGHLLMDNIAYITYDPDLLDAASDGIQKAWKSQQDRFKNLKRFEVNFSKKIHDVDRRHLRNAVENMSPEELATEKVNILARRGQNFLNRRFLRAAENDGFNGPISVPGIEKADLSGEGKSNDPAHSSGSDVKAGGHSSVVRDDHQRADPHVQKSDEPHKAMDTESDTSSTALIALLAVLFLVAVLGITRWIRRKKDEKH